MPAAACWLLKKLGAPLRLSLLHKRTGNPFTEGTRELFDLAGQGRIDFDQGDCDSGDPSGEGQPRCSYAGAQIGHLIAGARSGSGCEQDSVMAHPMSAPGLPQPQPATQHRDFGELAPTFGRCLSPHVNFVLLDPPYVNPRGVESQIDTDRSIQRVGKLNRSITSLM